jgi:hypothetical protein
MLYVSCTCSRPELWAYVSLNVEVFLIDLNNRRNVVAFINTLVFTSSKLPANLQMCSLPGILLALFERSFVDLIVISSS